MHAQQNIIIQCSTTAAIGKHHPSYCYPIGRQQLVPTARQVFVFHITYFTYNFRHGIHV